MSTSKIWSRFQCVVGSGSAGAREQGSTFTESLQKNYFLSCIKQKYKGWLETLPPHLRGDRTPLSADGSRHWENQPLCATLQHAFDLGEQADNLTAGASAGSRNKWMPPPNTLPNTGTAHNSMLDAILFSMCEPLPL